MTLASWKKIPKEWRYEVPGPENPLIGDFRKLTAREWARGAHLDLDEAVLAWMLASEAEWEEVVRWPQYGKEILRACKRESLATNKPLVVVVTEDGTRDLGAGRFGRQATGRYCASTQWPRVAHLNLARQVLAEPMALKDAQTGARRWMHGRTQDGGKQGGKALKFNALDIVRRRWDQGFCWVGPQYDEAGDLLIDPYLLWLGRPKRPSDRLEHGLVVIEDGRQRYKVKIPTPPPATPPKVS